MREPRILITGASGLLGLNLALEAVKERSTVFGQANRRPLHTSAFTVVQADLLAPGAVQRLLEETRPDWVIHCAALANLEACEADPAQARQLNSEVPRQLARHVARGGARLLHVSTDAVFDGQRGGYSEEDAPNPLSIYAQTKLEGERAVAEEDPAALVARVNLFGWSASGKRSLAEFFFNNLSAGKPVMGFTDVYFCPLLANDLAHIFLKMLGTGLGGLYHVVSSECISKYEFGVQIARKFGLDESLVSPTSWQEAGLAAARSPNLSLRIDKLIHDLGETTPNLSAGLERFYTLYQQGYPQKFNDYLHK
ncbi:MAG: SDR family oxidoreductase [Anaerolineales bacterium]|nr:SDR family oxidoreductase [Anaerolineales bacterium]